MQFFEATTHGRRGLKVRYGWRPEAQVTWEVVSMLRKPVNESWSCSHEHHDECLRNNNVNSCPKPCTFLIPHVGARNTLRQPTKNPRDSRRLYLYFARMIVISR